MTPPPSLLDRAVGWRDGIVADVAKVPSALADLPVANWAASAHPTAPAPAGGGAALDDADARNAAIGEALERYAASTCPLPEISPGPTPHGAEAIGLDAFTLHSLRQRAHPEFPIRGAYEPGAPLTPAFSTVDNREVLVPLALVTLDPHRSVLATSSGLAADTSPLRALLRAVQELVERDALMTTWLHGVAARRVRLPPEFAAPVVERGGAVVCLDITPNYSPHPVAAVAGNLPLRGHPRLSLGVACRSRWDEAVDKAWREWAQGAVFAGEMRGRHPDRAFDPHDVTDFDIHAAYYTFHPDRWVPLPIWRGSLTEAPPDARVVGSPAREVRSLTASLAARGVDTYYRELTTVDVAQIGLRVVRALAPKLTPIHADHRWPYLGGSAGDLWFRYPWAKPNTSFPIDAPHPLG